MLNYRSKIIIEYLKKFPNASTNEIARVILNDYPLDFKNFETVRGAVRYHRGEHVSKKTSEFQRDEVTKKNFIKKFFDLPESDYK